MEHGLTLGDLAETVHTYPTYAGLARKVANAYADTRLAGGFMRSAVKWFLGYRPRDGGPGAGPARVASEETGGAH
jgi:hypothetical protein